MVKLKGPGMATSAAGGLGKTLIFAESKGRPYLKKWHKPRNPKTRPQVAMRAMMGFLSNDWKQIKSTIEPLWIPFGQNRNISAFNAFLSFNVERWRSFLPPSQTPDAPGGGAGFVGSYPVLTAVSRGIQFDWNITTINQTWTFAIYHVPNFGDPQEWHLLIHHHPLHTTGNYRWTWRPLQPGTYNIRVTFTLTTGWMFAGGTNLQATVT